MRVRGVQRYYDSATDTSAEAIVPSAIALSVLQAKLWAQKYFGDEAVQFLTLGGYVHAKPAEATG